MNSDPIQVMMIEDDEEDYLLTRDLFKEMGSKKYTLDWVSNFDDGLEELLKQKHDIYLIDYRLGAQTGLDLLKESQKRAFRTPLILLTGRGDQATDDEAMKAGIADYLIKGQLTAPLLERSIRYALKRAEALQDILDREENFRRLFNASFEGIIVHENGIIMDANSAVGNIFGYSSNEIIGTNLLSYSGEESHEALKQKFHSPYEHGYEATGLKKDGTRIFLDISCKPYLYKGKIARLMAIRDISERKILQAQLVQQDRLASVGFLASGLAHEIGTPLGVIRGRAEYLAMYPNDAGNLKSGMEIIIAQIDRISKLIHSLLNLARKESSEISVAVSFPDALNDVIALMRRQLEKAEITIKTSVLAELNVKSVRSQLEQVLLNLIINSTHAIDSAKSSGRIGGHFITISAKESNQFWDISVTDTGCGIPASHLRHIFEPFFTTKDPGVGTGLGLSITQQLITSWGGSISCESREGVGTTFRIRLPRA